MGGTGQVVAVVFARGGSRGVPRKNLQEVGGRTLVAHAVGVARACRSIDRVVVSTDDNEIAQEAERAGAEVPFMRPAELATDRSPEWLSWRHAVDLLEAAGPLELMVSVPPVCPLRIPADVESCIDLVRETSADLAITVTPTVRHPSFNIVRLDEEGYANLWTVPPEPVTRRQDVEPAFDVTAVAYAVRPDYVRRASSMFEGAVRAHVVPQERALDIDSAFDLRVAQLLAVPPPDPLAG